MSDALAIATLESFLIMHDNKDYQIATETYTSALTLADQMSVKSYQQLVTLEHNIIGHGIGLSDVAALEAAVPGILSNAMPVNGFTYQRSMQNVEYALERINIAKLSALAAAGTAIVKFAKWVYEFVKSRVEAHRDKRALAAAEKLSESLKAFRNSKDQANKENGLSKDIGTTPKPGGATSHSQVKPTYAVDKQYNIYNDIWVKRFGLPSGAYSTYQQCKTVSELTAFLARNDATGPAFFINSPNTDLNVILEFVKQSTVAMDQLAQQQRRVISVIDGAIAGGSTDLGLNMNVMIPPLQALSANLGSNNIIEQIDDGATRLKRWTQTRSLNGSLLLQQPKIIPDILTKLVENFQADQIMATMSKYASTYEDVSRQIQMKTEQYVKSVGQGEASESVVKQVEAYNSAMKDLVELYRMTVLTYGNLMDYLTSFASAINIFMEH